ncbi:MAG: hypothetical protein R2724_22890 [Bryobacterales bacterium]
MIEPPAEPRPVNADCGPFTTSTCSMLNGSRDCGPRSRTPSTKTSLRALKPRKVRLSPAGVPPSPAITVSPVTLESTSLRLIAPCWRITCWSTTVIVWGMSRNGAVYLGDVGSGVAWTSTEVTGPKSSSSATAGAVNR